MSLRGGYQIINLDNREFSTEQGNVEKYEDVYKNLLNSHAKFIVLSGLNMDGIKWGDREAIFYEQQNGDGVYFQAELRRIWNTANKTCTTKYINIFPDDTVKMTVDSFIYEPDNDTKLNSTSTNAVENKVIYNEFRKVYYNNGSQKLTAPLNMGSHPVFNNDSEDNTYIFEDGSGELSILKAGYKLYPALIDNNTVLTKGGFRVIDDSTFYLGIADLAINSSGSGSPIVSNMNCSVLATRHSLTLNGYFDIDSSDGAEDAVITFFGDTKTGIDNIIGTTRHSLNQAKYNMNIVARVPSASSDYDVINPNITFSLNSDGSNLSINVSCDKRNFYLPGGSRLYFTCIFNI